MKVLFVCKGNVGRSQMAEAIFNSLAEGKAISSSCGVDPKDAEGTRVGERGPLVARCMKEIGLYISDNVSKAITKDMFDTADLVVSMVDKSALPEYAQNSDKVTFWKIENPHFLDYDGNVKVRDTIYKNVAELVEKIKAADHKKAKHSYR